jgi:hypothetical protein
MGFQMQDREALGTQTGKDCQDWFRRA